MGFAKLSEILQESQEHQLPFWKVVLLDDVQERGVTEESSFEKMRIMYQEMRQADMVYDPSLRSVSGLVGGDGDKLTAYRQSGMSMVGPFLSSVMEKAVKMGESNACMRRIVAAPTAGSCGVIPAVLLTYEEQKEMDEDEMIRGLFVAAGIGEVLAASASIAGAEGGCQAEIGSASAMAAGALAYLENQDLPLEQVNECIVHAASLAIKNMLGLTCDPVAGLVEVPCVKRNVAGAVNAVISAEMIKAGIRSKIPPDEVIDSMRRTGKLIPACLRETGEEGLAITPTAQEVVKKLQGKE